MKAKALLTYWKALSLTPDAKPAISPKMPSPNPANEGILYQPDEKPSHPASFAHGFQSVVGNVISMAAVASISALAGGQSEDYAAWLFFGSLAVCGLARIFQTLRIWRFGSGYSITVASSSAFLAVCIATLAEGGPAMLSSLLAISALIQFVVISRLSLLRRIITPTVTGTVLMLVSATSLLIILGNLGDMPEGAPAIAAPVLAGTTLAVLVGVRLFAPSGLQQWAAIAGLVWGCAAAAVWGLYDFGPALSAGWIGIPSNEWPGFYVGLDATFWALLPGFAIVVMATTIRSISSTVAIQQVAWRKPRATDFRVVQGSHNVVALSNLLAALIGALPNAISGSNSARVLLTGVAARRVGVYAGVIMIVFAALPKAIALAVAIPRPVLVAYVVFMMSAMFVDGMRMALSDGMSGKKATIIGVSLWLGVGFGSSLIFPDLLTGSLGTLLSSGVTIGAVCVIALSALSDLSSRKGRSRLNAEASVAALPRIDEFLRNFASNSGWDESSGDRLRAAGEETLASLLSQDGDGDGLAGKRLVVDARRSDGHIELEFMTASAGENLEDRLAYVGEQRELTQEHEMSFRLLRHYASSVNHRKYYDIDVVTVRVDERPA